MEKIVKRLLLVFTLLCLIPAVHAQTDALNQAVTACANGDFAGMPVLEQAVEAGARDGVLFYDLGMCYAGAGQVGKALLNVLRAARLMPRDADVTSQLDQMRARRIDLPEDEADFFTLAGTVTARTMTTGELAFISLLCWTAFFILLVIYRLRPNWQFTLRIVLTAAAIGLAGVLILLSSRLYIESSRPSAVIVSPSVQAMSGPADDYLPLFTLAEAAEVRILETRSVWQRVVLPGGRQGWIRAETLETINR